MPTPTCAVYVRFVNAILDDWPHAYQADWSHFVAGDPQVTLIDRATVRHDLTGLLLHGTYYTELYHLVWETRDAYVLAHTD